MRGGEEAGDPGGGSDGSVGAQPATAAGACTCHWRRAGLYCGGEGGGVGGGDEEKEGNQHKEAEPRGNGAAAGINDALVDG